MNAKRLMICAAMAMAATATMAQTYNPYQSIGREARVLTLSNGKYEEFFDTDTLEVIGSAILNTKTMKVIGFVVPDTLYSEANLEPELVSRWLSPDPLAAKYPELSPYHSFANNPILYVDEDGRENTIYLVVATDKSGKPSISKETAKEIEDKANEYLKHLGGNTRVSLYLKSPDEFDPAKMDQTDVLAVVGNTKADVTRFFEKEPNDDSHELAAKAWEGSAKNPERSQGAFDIKRNKFVMVSYSDVRTDLATSNEIEGTALAIVHGAGHTAAIGSGEQHRDGKAPGLGFMNSGTNLNNQLRENSGNPKFLFEPNQFGMLKIKNAWKEKFYPNNEKHEPKLNE